MENIKTNECVVCGEIVDFLNVKDGVTDFITKFNPSLTFSIEGGC